MTTRHTSNFELVAQRLAVASSCVILYILAIRVPCTRGENIGMLVLLAFLACIEKLCSIMNLVSVEKGLGTPTFESPHPKNNSQDMTGRRCMPERPDSIASSKCSDAPDRLTVQAIRSAVHLLDRRRFYRNCDHRQFRNEYCIRSYRVLRHRARLRRSSRSARAKTATASGTPSRRRTKTRLDSRAQLESRQANHA